MIQSASRVGEVDLLHLPGRLTEVGSEEEGEGGLERTGGGLEDANLSIFKATIESLHELKLNLIRCEGMVEIP